MRNDQKKLRGPFTPLYTDATRKCPAWYAMDPRARALVAEIKLLFDRVAESAVGMSSREAAKLLNISDHHIAVRMLKQAVYYGFLVKIADGYLGPDGKGIATQWRLTDEPYLGQPATLDFLRWDGTLFEEKPGSEKTKPRGSRNHRPVVAGTTPCGDTNHRLIKKARKNSKTENRPPVVARTTFLRSSPSSTASKPVSARNPEPEPSIGRNAEPVTKAEQDLVLMVTVLSTLLGNRTTSTAWQQHMQSFCGAGWSRPSFKRRLKVLKDREWIRIVGEPDADLERAPEGSHFEATEIAPGISSQQGSNLAHESAAMNGAADAAAKAAMELVQRLNKGKPSNAA